MDKHAKDDEPFVINIDNYEPIDISDDTTSKKEYITEMIRLQMEPKAHTTHVFEHMYNPNEPANSGGRYAGNPTFVYEERYQQYTFNNNDIRREFVRNVCMIVASELFITILFMIICMFVPDLRIFVARNWIAAICVTISSFVVLIVLVCCLRKVYPINIILMYLFVILMSYSTAFLCCRYQNYIIFMGAGTTSAIVLFIALCAIFIPCDMTKFYMYFVIGGFALMLCGLIVMVIGMFYYSYLMHTIYGSIVVVFFSLYLWFDIQLMMGGKRYELEPDEYVLASINIYIDIIMIFTFVVALFGGGR